MIWIVPATLLAVFLMQLSTLDLAATVSLGAALASTVLAAGVANGVIRRIGTLYSVLVGVLVSAFVWGLYGAMPTAMAVGSAAYMSMLLIQSSERLSNASMKVVVPIAIWLGVHVVLVVFGLTDLRPLILGLVAIGIGLPLGWICKVAMGLDSSRSDDVDELLADAIKALADVRLVYARRQLAKAVRLAPDRLDVIRANYAAWKYEPTHEEFHRAAEMVFRALLEDEALLGVYKDYLAVTQVRPQLGVELHLAMAEKLADAGHPDDAARIVNVFLQRDIESPTLLRTLVSLMRSYDDADNMPRAIRYADIIIGEYPRSSAAKLATTLISRRREN